MGTLDFAGIEQLMVQALMTAWTLGAGSAMRDARAHGIKSVFAEPEIRPGYEPVPPEEAIKWIQERAPLPLKRLEDLLDSVRDDAAGLTRDLVDTISDKIDASMAEQVKAGADMDAWLKGLDGVVEQSGLTAEDPFYWETVFRTNVQTAYGAGRYEMLRNPEIEEAFGYYQYLTVEDSAVREEHAALHGKVWPADAPEVSEFWPPNGFNCRCSMVPISAEEIEAEGLEVQDGPVELDGEDVVPDEGFEGPPKLRFEVKP